VAIDADTKLIPSWLVGEPDTADAKVFKTLQVLHRVGATVTASNFGVRVGIEATTAGNRLVNLAKKGYVHRIERSRVKAIFSSIHERSGPRPRR